VVEPIDGVYFVLPRAPWGRFREPPTQKSYCAKSKSVARHLFWARNSATTWAVSSKASQYAMWPQLRSTELGPLLGSDPVGISGSRHPFNRDAGEPGTIASDHVEPQREQDVLPCGRQRRECPDVLVRRC
jgi:hypothetical protein